MALIRTRVTACVVMGEMTREVARPMVESDLMMECAIPLSIRPV
jgi:hypothetical protein